MIYYKARSYNILNYTKFIRWEKYFDIKNITFIATLYAHLIDMRKSIDL